MSCGCGCGGHGGCGDARAHAPRRRRPFYTGRLRRRGYEPEYMAAPAFSARMSFAAALANSATNSAGLYRIYKDGRPVYAGRAAPGTIRSRLQNHRWCLTHMAVDDAAYTVSFAPMSGSTTAQVVAAEKSEIRRMRRNRVHRGTNVREGEHEGEQIIGWIRRKLSKKPAPAQPPPPGSPYRIPGEEPPPSSRPPRPPRPPVPPAPQPARQQRDSDYGMGIDSPPSSRR